MIQQQMLPLINAVGVQILCLIVTYAILRPNVISVNPREIFI